MKNQKEILEEIKRCAPDDRKDKIAGILRRKNHSKKQEEAIMNTWLGLLWWRRTHVELMVKEYETT